MTEFNHLALFGVGKNKERDKKPRAKAENYK